MDATSAPRAPGSWAKGMVKLNQRLRHEAHEAFDRLWRPRGVLMRGICYRWLAYELGIPVARCHFAELTHEEIGRARAVCERASVAQIDRWQVEHPDLASVPLALPLRPASCMRMPRLRTRPA